MDKNQRPVKELFNQISSFKIEHIKAFFICRHMSNYRIHGFLRTQFLNSEGFPKFSFSTENNDSQKQPPEVFYKKIVLENFAKFIGKHLSQSLFFNKFARACNFIKKETLVQVFSCEFCEIFKNTFFYRTPLG